MVEIKFIDEKEEWNKKLKLTVNHNVFSSFEWGKFKQSNWEIKRLAFYKSGNFLGQCQMTLKSKSFVTFAWLSGGINLVDFKYLEEVINSLKEYFERNKYLVRINFYDINNGAKKFTVSSLIEEPAKRINSGFSVIHNFNLQDDLLKKMSSNHRYYVKKAMKNNLTIKFGSGKEYISGFIKLHSEMIDLKKLDSISISENELKRLSEVFDEKILIPSVYYEDELIASCIILISEKQSFYYLAASNEKGRKLYASYFMISELFSLFKEKKIIQFDFGGITPFNKKAYGVNKFKLGFGGKTINYLGEWEFSNSKLLTLFFNKVYLKC